VAVELAATHEEPQISLLMPQDPASSVVLFDGVCNVCNGAVNFIIDRDRAGAFHFASLQSEVGKALCTEHGVPAGLDTIVLVENGRAFVESSAVLRIVRRLEGPARWLVVFALLPRFLRDGLYRYFAAHRYAWFGRRDVCRVPTPDIRRRFLGE